MAAPSTAVLSKQLAALTTEIETVKATADATLALLSQMDQRQTAIESQLASLVQKRANASGKSAAATAAATVASGGFEIGTKTNVALQKNQWFAQEAKAADGDNDFVKKMATRYGVVYKNELGTAATPSTITRAHNAMVKKIQAFKDSAVPSEAAYAKNFEDDYAAYKASVTNANATPLEG